MIPGESRDHRGMIPGQSRDDPGMIPGLSPDDPIPGQSSAKRQSKGHSKAARSSAVVALAVHS